MGHGPATEWKPDKCEGFKTKLGFIMFVVYTIVYFIFIIIAVTNPQMLGNDVGSLNLAITYGFGIIILAIILALIYNYACSKREKQEDSEEGEAE